MTGLTIRHRDCPGLIVGGLTPLSSLDYPGALAGVIFCRGCPWQCPYCHNAALQDASGDVEDVSSILDWLEGRRGLLDAVVFSGGEPTRQPALGPAMDAARALGFRIGLHTAGMFPEALAAVLPRCDWVGLDIKAPPKAYDRLTGRPGSAAPAFASLALLQQYGMAFEVRTTWHPALLNDADMTALAETLVHHGIRQWTVQTFRPQGCADPALAAAGPVAFPDHLPARLRALFPALKILLRD